MSFWAAPFSADIVRLRIYSCISFCSMIFGFKLLGSTATASGYALCRQHGGRGVKIGALMGCYDLHTALLKTDLKSFSSGGA